MIKLQSLIIVIALSVFLQNVAAEKNIYLIPFIGFEENDLLFDPNTRDNLAQPFITLKKKLKKLGFNIVLTNYSQDALTKEPLIVFDAPPAWFTYQLMLHPQNNRYLFLWEPPVISQNNYQEIFHRPFSKIYTMIDSLVDNKRYFKFYYPQATLTMTKERIPFNQKKMCVIIASIKYSPVCHELYSKRLEVIRDFETMAPADLDFYGFVFTDKSPLYKGRIEGKVHTLKNYKFCICFENMHCIPGYISEKIFDCFIAGCVPIYWGAENITDYIPSNCFIDRRNFNDNTSLYAYLQSLTEKDYATYLENIQLFLQSDKAYLFSSDYFVDLFGQLLVSQYNRSSLFNQNKVDQLNRIAQL